MAMTCNGCDVIDTDEIDFRDYPENSQVVFCTN